MIEFILNNQHITTYLPTTTLLLDFLRKEKRLTGTKEGCREGDCGACTVLTGEVVKGSLKYRVINSCLMPINDVGGMHVVTVEGINRKELSPVQLHMADQGGTQCGFCTPGFVISLTGYFLSCDNPEIEGAVNILGGNICRCTGYTGIMRAAGEAIKSYLNTDQKLPHIDRLISAGFIPPYFKKVKKQLNSIKRNVNRQSKALFFIGGGTDLYVQRWEEILKARAGFVSQTRISKEILKSGNRIKIGGGTTIQQVIESPLINKYFPVLRKKLELFGSLQIRNRATVSGNIVNASPIGDLTNILMALNAELHLSGKKKRSVFIRDFYKGYKILNKTKNEVIESISFPVPPRNFYFNFEKVSKRTYLDIAGVNSTLGLTLSRGKIEYAGLSAGGVAPYSLYLKKTCEFLNGKEINTQTVKGAAETAMEEIAPISDARGTADYKRLLLRQLIYAHFLLLFPQKVNDAELL